MATKRVAKPKAAKPPEALFLITEADERLDGTHVRAGMFENPKPDEIRAYEPDDIAFGKLTTRNSRYLQFDRLWPVRTNVKSALVRDDMWGGWNFALVELGAPLRLSEPATWQMLLDAGLRKKPKKKDHPSLLVWPAIKGHLEVVKLLLAAGADPRNDAPLLAAAAFGQRETARCLAESGLDGKEALASMRHYKNAAAIEILLDLGFGP